MERLVDDLVEGVGVVERQAGVLGQRQQNLLVAGGVAPIRIARGEAQAAGHLAALEHRRRHPGAQFLERPVARHLPHQGVRVLVDDDQPSLGDRLRADPGRAATAPGGEELLAHAQRGRDRGPVAGRVAQSQQTDLVAEQLAPGLEDLLEDLVQRALSDDRALDARESFQQHLALAQREQEPGVLLGLALGSGAERALGVDQAQRLQSEPDHPSHPVQEVELLAGEALAGAGDHENPAVTVGDRDGNGMRIGARHVDRVAFARDHHTQLAALRHLGRRPGGREDAIVLDQDDAVGVEHLGRSLHQPRHRRALVGERAEQRQELRELLGGPTLAARRAHQLTASTTSV